MKFLLKKLNTYFSISKTLHLYHMTQQFYFWCIPQRNKNTNSERYMHHNAQSSIIYNR